MTPQDLDKALADLQSGVLRRQVEAQTWLLEQAEESAHQAAIAERLAPLAAHADAQVRGTAYLALATAQGERALPVLQGRLSEEVAGARCALAHAATILGAPGQPILRALVRDRVDAVRREAALGLAQLGDAAGLDDLVQALGDASQRFEALSALQELGDARAVEPVRRLFRRFFLPGFERTAAAGVLARLGDAEGRAFLVALLARRKGDALGLAIEIAGDLKIQEAAPALDALSQDPSHLFRGAAMRSLGMIGAASALERCAQALLDEGADPAVRMDAAEGLMHLGTPQARAALEEASRRVRDEAVAAVVREALASSPAPP